MDKANCPICGASAAWLSTTNRWDNKCGTCRIRFDDANVIRPQDEQNAIEAAARLCVPLEIGPYTIVPGYAQPPHGAPFDPYGDVR